MAVQLSEKQLNAVVKKLDSVKLELLRLRASLLPQEELTAEEKKELALAIKEYEEGRSIPLPKLRRKPR
ncbi:MAG: hypothetical protein HYU39_06125 [Thaumarchaeota archaeon]|nr:hypothetical protein [Nitrososphaerota archaeon]